MVARGQIWWAELPEPSGSEPGFRRPVVVVQSDPFNQSHINTVIVVVITSNLKLANAPGNVKLSKSKSGLDRESVINVSQIITIDKRSLTDKIGSLEKVKIGQLNEGIEMALGL